MGNVPDAWEPQRAEWQRAYVDIQRKLDEANAEVERLRAEIGILTEQNRILRVNLDYLTAERIRYRTADTDDVHSSQPEKKL